MTLRWLAALALLGCLGGCANLLPAGLFSAKPSQAQAGADGEPAARGSATAPAAASNVGIEVDAPPPLRALLERYLDIVRLGRAAPADVDDGEWARLIDATPGQVRDLLQTEGYFEPDVMLERTASADGLRTERVRLRVDPGVQARVGRVTLDVEGELGLGAAAGESHAAITLARLRQRLDDELGTPFRNEGWSGAKAAVLAAARAAGYANAVFSGTSANVDAAEHSVRLFVVLDSGPLYRLGTLEIEGLVQHDVQTVRNLALTRTGVPVTESLLLDFQERLQKAGLFDSVTVTLDTDTVNAAAGTSSAVPVPPVAPSQARVRVRLREAPLQVYTVGLGFSANTGYRASGEHLYRRVFGYAASARNKAEWGDKRQAWEGEIIGHPGPGLYRNLLGGAVENLKTDTDTVLSQRLRVGRSQDTQKLERLFFLEAERSARTPTGGDKTSTFALSGNFQGAWRSLDNILLPTRGATLNIQLGLGRAHGDQSDNGWFTRAYGRVVGYLPLAGWYGQARLELGQVFLPNNVVVPESKRFRAGGDESVRGYTFRSLGPLVDGAVGGGLSLFTGSVEVARPISDKLPSVWGAVFVDAGNAADSFGRLRPVYGTGLGVRWRSPVGPLRLDWAYGSQTRAGRFHFSVGIAY